MNKPSEIRVKKDRVFADLKFNVHPFNPYPRSNALRLDKPAGAFAAREFRLTIIWRRLIIWFEGCTTWRQIYSSGWRKLSMSQ